MLVNGRTAIDGLSGSGRDLGPLTSIYRRVRWGPHLIGPDRLVNAFDLLRAKIREGQRESLSDEPVGRL